MVQKGDRVKLISMPGDPDPIPVGAEGTVVSVDSCNHINMQWDNGRTLNLIGGFDQFEVLGK